MLLERKALVGPALLLVATVVACTDFGKATASVPDSTFVRTMVELERLSDDTLVDSTMRDSARHMILRRHRVSSDQLIQAAQAMAGDPDHAIRVWTAIDSLRYEKTLGKPTHVAPSVSHPNAATPARPR